MMCQASKVHKAVGTAVCMKALDIKEATDIPLPSGVLPMMSSSKDETRALMETPASYLVMYLQT